MKRLLYTLGLMVGVIGILFVGMLVSTSISPDEETQNMPLALTMAPSVFSDDAEDDAATTTFPLCIYNANSVSITIEEIDYEPGEDLYASITVENGSEHAIYFEILGCELDHITFPFNVFLRMYPVSAGATGSCDFVLEWSNIAPYDLEDVHSIAFHCDVYDSDSSVTLDEFRTDDIILSPDSNYAFPLPVDSYECVYDNDGLKLYDLGLIDDKACALAYNDTDQELLLMPLEISFDGEMDYNGINPSEYIYPHTYFILPIDSSRDISSCTQAHFSLWVYALGPGQNTFLYESDPIELKLK